MVAVIDEALSACKARVRELERQIDPLVAERDQLREAIRRLQGVTAMRSAGDGGLSLGVRVRAGGANGHRAPRGQNRRRILRAIRDEPKTATEIARETKITVGTVSTTLTKLVKDGAAQKAPRGYKAS